MPSAARYVLTVAIDAFRGVRRNRRAYLLAFAVLAVALTISVVTYSVVYAVLLQPLPYASPSSLVSISAPNPIEKGLLPASPSDYFAWREQARTLDSLAAVRFSTARVELGGRQETVHVRQVTTNVFAVLGLHPLRGSLFGQAGDPPPGTDAAVLSYSGWMRFFAGGPDVIGQLIPTTSGVRRIVGVLPRDVVFPITPGPQPDMYVPMPSLENERANTRCCLLIVARLRAGISVEAARADVNHISPAVVLPLMDQVIGPAKAPLQLALAAVVFVLLVGYVNVSCLLLARAVDRTSEFATRGALGATPTRLAVTVLFEGSIISLGASGLAVVASLWGISAARGQLPPELNLNRTASIALNLPVLFTALAAAVACGLLAGAVPAWVASRDRIMERVNATARGLVRPHRALTSLVVADVALISVLLVLTSLSVTTFVRIATADLGFDRRQVISIWYNRSLNSVPERQRPAAVRTFESALLESAASAPGVSAVALSSVGAPLSSSRTGAQLTIPGYGRTAGFEIESREVSAGYFPVLGIDLIRGRLIGRDDRQGAPRVMLINDVMARRYFAGRDPIGQIVDDDGPVQIIGIVRGAHVDGPEADVPPEIYIPWDQTRSRVFESRSEGPFTSGGLLVRTRGRSREAYAALHQAILPALGGRVPDSVEFMDDVFARRTVGRRLMAIVLVCFGTIGLGIAALGVHGTMAFLVTSQMRSAAVRLALGASPMSIRRRILFQALWRVGCGLTIGLTGAWAASSGFRSLVFGVEPAYFVVYATVAGVIVLLGLLAALGPALRAGRIDPVLLLREG